MASGALALAVLKAGSCHPVARGHHEVPSACAEVESAALQRRSGWELVAAVWERSRVVFDKTSLNHDIGI